ncbi:MAG TPA: hypothetical protein VGC29_05850, partial [Flavisolibacter sp.]
NGGKHVREKTFTSGDITVKWYHISETTTVHDFIDLERWGWTKTIMKSNTDGIYDILIKNDTVTIQTTKDLLVYELITKTLNCHIKLDTTITTCQYMKMHVPENAKYYCNKAISDSIGIP